MLRKRQILLASALILVNTVLALGQHNTGVSPTAISLPNGPGSVRGLGSDFQPEFNSGMAVYAVKLEGVAARGESLPLINLEYNGGFGNGPFGLGWRLSLPWVQRRISNGLPTYTDGADVYATDLDEKLIAVEDSAQFTTYRKEIEKGFTRFRFVKASGIWIVDLPDGGKQFYGEGPEDGIGVGGRIKQGDKTFAWLPSRFVDRHGNEAHFYWSVMAESPGQVYLSEIRYNFDGSNFASISFNYERRPDALEDYRAGFLIRNSYLCTDIVVKSVEKQVRHYRLAYLRPNGLSSLMSIGMAGADDATSLPTLKFDYTSFSLNQSITAMTLPGVDAPAAGPILHGQAELHDLNGDSLPDILETQKSSHFYYANLGNGKWDSKRLLDPDKSLQLSNPDVNLADMDGDLRTDLVVKGGTSSDSFKYYKLQPDGHWAGDPVRFSGNTFSFSLNDPNVRFLDLNNDRQMDLMYTGSSSTWQYWLNQGVDELGRHKWVYLTGGAATPAQFSGGLQLADMNGDGLLDLVSIRPLGVSYWPNMGNGRWDAGRAVSNPPDLGSKSIRTQCVDVNGDGLSDLVLVNSGSVSFWLNLGGESFAATRNVDGTPTVDVHTAIRFADMNGNGSRDILWIKEDVPAANQMQFLDLCPSKPGLLSLIDNGIGRTVTLEYTTSTAEAVRDQEEQAPWQDFTPLPVPIISKIYINDGLDNRDEKKVRYRNAFFGLEERRFAGFVHVEISEAGDQNAAARTTNYEYDVGKRSKWLRGLQVAEEIRDGGGNLLRRETNDWEERQLLKGLSDEKVAVAFKRANDIFQFEAGKNPAHVRTEYQYDDFGNRTAELFYGVVGAEGQLGQADDEALVYTDYNHLVTKELWVVNYKAKERKTNLSAKKISETQYLYDNLPLGQISEGNLTEKREWLDTEDRYLSTLKQSFDKWGNVTEFSNARGDRRSKTFDGIYHIYPVSETIHLAGYALTVMADVDVGFGTITSFRDFAIVGETQGALTRFVYDALGRLVKVIKPGDTVALPTTEYEYHLGSPVSFIERRSRIVSGQARLVRSRSFFDSFSRPLGRKTLDDEGKWIFTEARRYDNEGNIAQEWQPIADSGEAWLMPSQEKPSVTSRHDALGRSLERTLPDKNFSTVAYAPLERYETDENSNLGNTEHLRPYGHYRTYQLDGRERTVGVIERNGAEIYLTQYTYDANDRLVRVTDAQGNVKVFRYDSLGRKIYSNDPDMGERWYRYDDAGNLIELKDARGQRRVYLYDAAERITEERYFRSDQSGTNGPSAVKYNYDRLSAQTIPEKNGLDAANSAGRLSWVLDQPGEEYMAYDARGNLVYKDRRLLDAHAQTSVSFITRQAFNSLDQLASRTYPDNDQVLYDYNARGMLARVTGGDKGVEILRAVEYAPSGSVGSIVYGNNLTANYGYDNRQRVQSFNVARSASSPGTELLNYRYSYDAASNLKTTEDLRQSLPAGDPRLNSQAFGYDDLNRLRSFRLLTPDGVSTLEKVEYSYDKIGNLTYKSSSGEDAAGRLGHGKMTPTLNLGEISYGGNGGASGRIGRGPLDPPGPHCATQTKSGNSYVFDANGNTIRANGTEYSWDFNDRLSAVRNGGTTSTYLYDYQGRRLVKEVNTGGELSRTLYPFEFFEIQDGLPATKYVFLDQKRVAAIKGMAGPLRERRQFLQLQKGWNSVSIDIEPARATAGDVFGLGADPAVERVLLEQSGKGPSLRRTQTLSPGRKYFVYMSQARVRVVQGKYRPRINSADERRRISDDILFYQSDYLNSTDLVTDANGQVVAETSYYPEGVVRHQEAAGSFRPKYQFAGKERDAESDNYYFGARYYDPVVGQFLSADPLYADVDRFNAPGADSQKFTTFLNNPQRINLYAYGLRNPLRYSDPTGADSVDMLQLSLAGVGLIPGPIGQVANVTNAAISITRGDYLAAGLSLAAAIPITGTYSGVAAVERFSVKAAEKTISTARELTPIAAEASAKVAAKATIQFGKGENQAWHAFRHVERIGLDREIVKETILQDFSKVVDSLPKGQYNGSVTVEGVRLDYSAFKLPDGTVNIGRITPPEP